MESKKAALFHKTKEPWQLEHIAEKALAHNRELLNFTNHFSEEELTMIHQALKKIYFYDNSLFSHCWQTAIYAFYAGIRLNISPTTLFVGGLLHDIGKTFIPYTILNKPGKLNKHEQDTIRQHPIIGAHFLSALQIKNKAIIDITEFHHKWYNGKGYPDNSAPEENLMYIQTISACDAFDAMTSPRPYAKPKTINEGLWELKRCSGTQFNPVIVEALWDLRKDIKKISNPLLSMN